MADRKMSLEELQELHRLLDEFYVAYLALVEDVKDSDDAWDARFAFDDVYNFVVSKEREIRGD
jgi:hypothetical protein